MNITPFLHAVSALRSLLTPRAPFVSADNFLAACDLFHDALGPDHIPGFPEKTREEIRNMSRQIHSLADDDGKIHRMPVGTFLLHDLRNLGLFPPAEILKNATALRSVLSGFIAGSAETGTYALQLGGETIRGFDEFDGPAEEALVSGALSAVATIPFGEALKSVQRGSVPLVNASSGHLLIQKPLYVNSTGETIPTVIESDFRLGRVIGQGGCSEVFSALERGTEREVAIKVVTIPDQKKRDMILKGFEEEIRDAPFSRSPRFVNVYATGRTARGNPFIAMEYLSGGALDGYLDGIRSDEIPFRYLEVLSLARQAAAAVAEMHRHGFIHRDIKAENFFLNGERRLKLGDQGLRKRLSEIPPEPDREPWGTPGYMPPEKVNAERPDDERTDVFALGAVLYELFTGIFCFDGPSAHAKLVNVIAKQPPPPGLAAPHRDIPEIIDRIVMKCLEKKPEDRYANALEVLYDLATVHAQELEEEANRKFQLSNRTGADFRIHEAVWQANIQASIRELQKVYGEFPYEEIQARIVRLNYELYVWADRVGNESELGRTRDNILRLAPYGPEAGKVRRQIQAHFLLEGLHPESSAVHVEVRHYEHSAGYFELDRLLPLDDGPPREPVSLERGGVYAAHVSGKELVSVVRDIPPRPGDYDLRIPLYSTREVPAGWVLHTAGNTAARTSAGSFAEHFVNWREVDHDYAMGPLATEADYFHFIKALARDDRDLAAARIPRHWGFDFFDQSVHRRMAYAAKNGQPIDWLAPVTHVTQNDALAYLAHLDEILRRKFRLPKGHAVRFPTLHEWRRAFRPDPREWAHGDGRPQVGDLAIRFRDPRGAGPIAPLPITALNLRDRSVFSVGDVASLAAKYDYRRPSLPSEPNPVPLPAWRLAHDETTRVVSHIVGNVQKFLHLGGPDDQTRITRALGLEGGELGTLYIATAGADCSMSPDNPDILNKHASDVAGLIGILPVLQLRDAPATPYLASLTARYLA